MFISHSGELGNEARTGLLVVTVSIFSRKSKNCVNIKCAMHDCPYTIVLQSDATAAILYAACFCAATS